MSEKKKVMSRAELEAEIEKAERKRRYYEQQEKILSRNEEYRKAGYSNQFFEAHREEITLHKAAKQAFDELGVKKIPKVKAKRTRALKNVIKRRFRQRAIHVLFCREIFFKNF